MKRILNVIMIFTLLMSMVVTVNASEDNVTKAEKDKAQKEIESIDGQARLEEKVKSGNSKIINEFEYVKNLSKMEKSELKGLGYTNEEIKEITNYKEKFDAHVKELSKKDVIALENLGYTEDQINAIQNYKGTEDELLMISATMSVNLDIDYCNYNSSTNQTTSRLYGTFDWNGCPAFKLTDIIGFGYDGWVKTGETSYVTYKNIYSGAATVTQRATFKYPTSGAGTGAGWTFKVSRNDNYEYADSGYAIVVLKSSNVKDMHTKFSYGHQTFGITAPSFSLSFPASASVSFNFTNSTDEIASDTDSMLCNQ